MRVEDEVAGEVLVVRNAFRSCVEVHIKGTAPEDYRVIRLARNEARRLVSSFTDLVQNRLWRRFARFKLGAQLFGIDS